MPDPIRQEIVAQASVVVIKVGTNVLTDSSGNGHHGKIVGGKWVKGDGTPIAAPGDYALRFCIQMAFSSEPHTARL